MTINLTDVRTYLTNLQADICQQIEAFEPTERFLKDDASDHGHTSQVRVIANGEVIEKGGVMFSHVEGMQLPPAATERYPQLAGCQFTAMGVSAIFHPRNPYAPTTHANVRFFHAHPEGHDPVWWFGGGYDLTPYYGFVEDCRHWHQTARDALDKIDPTLYPRYKTWCDEYFYLKHRQEARGIGGVFFDDLNIGGFERCYHIMQAVGNSFMPAYCPILDKRHATPYGERERDFQSYRRGRYVEFNLLYDRGTKFGIQFGGRTEAILSSMPPHADWRYNWQPAAGTPEAALYTDFLPPRDWVS